MSSQTRNIVTLGSERGENVVLDPKSGRKEGKEEKRKPTGSERKRFSQTRNIVDSGSGRENVLPDPRRERKAGNGSEERNTDSDRGIQKIVGNQMFNHAGV